MELKELEEKYSKLKEETENYKKQLEEITNKLSDNKTDELLKEQQEQINNFKAKIVAMENGAPVQPKDPEYTWDNYIEDLEKRENKNE